jgi:hypothetical protein
MKSLNKKAETHFCVSAFFERLAATYSRGTYRTTTIGKTVFDGRVRNGNGSDHSFIATKIVSAGFYTAQKTFYFKEQPK